MKKSVIHSLLAFLLSAAVSVSVSFAENATVKDVQRLGLALQLASYGEASDDAAAIAMAVALIAETPIGEPITPTKVEDAEGNPVAEFSSSSGLDPTSLLDLAEALAAEPAAEAMITRAKTSLSEKGTRGRVGGATLVVNTLQPYYSHFYQIEYQADEPAMVVVSADGSQGLDVYVFDPAGQIVSGGALSNDLGSLMVGQGGLDRFSTVEWTPGVQGEYLVRVVNNSDTPVGYILTTN